MLIPLHAVRDTPLYKVCSIHLIQLIFFFIIIIIVLFLFFFVQNDLMCYDKLESGILVLHKEDLTPLPFLQECFNGFRAEAQERGVTLNFNPPLGSNVRLFSFTACLILLGLLSKPRFTSMYIIPITKLWTHFPPTELPEEVKDVSSNTPVAPLRNNNFSFAALMNATATITGQRNHDNDPSLTLTDTDLINVDKFKVSEMKENTINPLLLHSNIWNLSISTLWIHPLIFMIAPFLFVFPS